ncbi:NUDIX domain-containing protein [Glycomyces halotolerans]
MGHRRRRTRHRPRRSLAARQTGVSRRRGFVGGWVDEGEWPHEGSAREIKEAIGLELTVGDLLVLDWIPASRFVTEPLTFYVFDGGVVNDPEAVQPRPGRTRGVRLTN